MKGQQSTESLEKSIMETYTRKTSVRGSPKVITQLGKNAMYMTEEDLDDRHALQILPPDKAYFKSGQGTHFKRQKYSPTPDSNSTLVGTPR